MDVGPICHAYKFMKFIKKVKSRKFLFFKLEFSNFVASWRFESYGKIQNFSSISLTLCLLDQKNTGTWGVNTTIARCDKQKWRYKVIHKCLGNYQDLNALRPLALSHLTHDSALNTSE